PVVVAAAGAVALLPRLRPPLHS
ncbi:hypothetical protein A2U01_0063098, partial [Trifolium medium]|nr:hypothetical protein [Trifolium medium]